MKHFENFKAKIGICTIEHCGHIAKYNTGVIGNAGNQINTCICEHHYNQVRDGVHILRINGELIKTTRS